MVECHSIHDLTKQILNYYSQGVKLVMFTGHIGAGKNYVAKEVGNRLQESGLTITYTSFASSLKKLIYNSLGLIKYSGLNNINKDIDDAVKKIISFFSRYSQTAEKYAPEVGSICVSALTSKDIRKVMQRLGALGRKINSDIWIFETYDTIELLKDGSDLIFITDLRYPNELEFMRNRYNCKVVRVVSPLNDILNRLKLDKDLYLKYLEHESEKSIEQIKDIDLLYVNISNN